MDNGLRQKERRRAQSGAPDDEALVLVERLRAGETTTNQLLLMGAAGIETACLALGLGRMQALEQVAQVLPAPSRDLFEPIVEQVKVIWELNQRLGWGFTASHFATAGLPTTWPSDRPHNLTVVTLVPYLDTVQATFDGLWQAIQSRHANSWRWDGLKSDEKHLRLLEGITHPGKCLGWETIDMAANWDQENGIAPRDVRDPTNSPHAGILAATAIHTKWVEAMDGTSVPYVWLPGYQFGGEPGWSRVPWLLFALSDRQVRLFECGGVNRNRSYAVPSFRGE